MFDLLIALCIALYQFIAGSPPLEALQYGSSWLPMMVNVVYAFVFIVMAITTLMSIYAKQVAIYLAAIGMCALLIVSYLLSMFLAKSMVTVFASAHSLSEVNWWIVGAIIALRYLITVANRVFKKDKKVEA